MPDLTGTSKAFQADWERRRGELLPLAHLLRAENIPWIRFHSLPLSKRYAGTKAEYATILSRANQLALELLGSDRECWLVQTAYPGMDELPELGGEAVVPLANFGLESDENEDEWAAYGCLTTWRSGKFDTLLTTIADDETKYVFWMDRETGAIFAPYDGGFDLFPASEATVAKLSRSFRDWLSAHPEGL